ncbi:MAG: glycosyltransferase family 2 protein [Actinomycetota bacterium]
MRKGMFFERPLGASSAASPAPASTSDASRRPARRVSVIVPVYNGEHVIEGCLRSLERQTIDPDEFEIVVIDDCSKDSTREIVERIAKTSRATIVMVEQERNAGPAAARNRGLALVSSPIIAFTDADCEVSETWLERALRRLDDDPGITAVEGATLPKGVKGTFTHQMENTRGQLYMTCNMIYRAAALGAGFDERFRLAFLEDSDVAFEVLERGGRICFEPDVVASHLVLQEGRTKFWREARKRFYNPLLYRKHPELYRSLLKPVVPAFPAHYVDYMLSVAILVVAIATRAWAVAMPAALLAAWMLKRVAFSLKARQPLAVLQAMFVPFVQTAWSLSGMIRFRCLSPRI